MMNETDFHRLADMTLDAMSAALEEADAGGLLDVEHDGGIITVELPDGRQFIVSKHAPSRQLWLSSPVSGGLHFRYEEAHQDWQLADGTSLKAVLSAELKKLAGVALV